MKKEKKKIPVLQIIIALLIIALFGYLLYSIFNPGYREVSAAQFEKWLEVAKVSESDETYFSWVKFTDYKRTVTFNFVNEGKSMTYIAGIDADYLTNGGLSKWNLDNKGAFFHPKFNYNESINSSASLVKDTPFFLTFLYNFGPVILITLVMFLLYRAQMKGGAGGIFSPGKNQAQKIISDKKFADIAGNEEVKEEVKELVDYLKNPQKYSVAGARIPKGILLGGPPGTGKTLIAKATAGEASVPFFFISGSNFVEMFVGVGAKRVRELFKEARKEGPAIIFIDELDAVGRSRGAGLGGGNDEREQTLNQLLVEMDGMTENGGILVMAATNRTDVLDPALLRPGRFDRTITVNLPDIKEREEILKLHAKGKRIDSSITFNSLAKRTPGYSGAQLENVINEAALLSVREDTGIITKEQIDEAIDRVMAGPAKKTRTISAKELEMVAYHEAGHAVVGLKVPGGNKVQKITIIPRGDAGGYNLMLPEEEKYNKTKLELEAMIKSFMGGRAAEEFIYGPENISTGATDDIQKATTIARRMVTEWGMSSLGPIQYEEPEGSVFLGRDYTKSKVLSDTIAHEIEIEIRKIIKGAQEEAKKIIKENKKLLTLIKDSLLENETIVAEEIEYIDKNMKLMPREKTEKIKEKNQDIDLNKIIDTVIEKDKKSSQPKKAKTNGDSSKTKTLPFDSDKDKKDSKN